MFAGVEFVCCPLQKELVDKQEQLLDFSDSSSSSSSSSEEDNNNEDGEDSLYYDGMCFFLRGKIVGVY